MAITELCIDEFHRKENLSEFPFAFSHAIKARQQYLQYAKDLSCFCGIGFLWRLFQCGHTYLLTFGSDINEFKNRYLLFGIKHHLQMNKNEVSVSTSEHCLLLMMHFRLLN